MKFPGTKRLRNWPLKCDVEKGALYRNQPNEPNTHKKLEKINERLKG